MKIGITLGRPTGTLHEAVWASGIGQNAALLLLLFQRLAAVDQVVGVCGQAHLGPNAFADWAGVPTLDPATAAAELDVIVELGLRCAPEAMHAFRARGGRLVSYMAGNAMVMNKEALSSGLPHGEVMSEIPFDAAWITPQHWATNRAYCALTRSAVVEQVPHIWEPVFLESAARAAQNNPFFRQAPAAWRIGVMEPNVNVLKTFHLPLMVAEHAFRLGAPIERVLLFNTQRLVGTAHFDDITTTTDLARAGRLTAEPRLPTAHVLGRHIDAVVAHHWQNDLNYLYWDVLWTGHPLIHNSPAAAEVGYHYADWNPADGGRVLAEALQRHAHDATYRPRAVDFLNRFRIDDPTVLARHAQLLAQIA